MIGRLVEMIALTIAELRVVTAGQWLLRLAAALAAGGATWMVMLQGVVGGAGTSVGTVAVIIGASSIIWQTLRPDAEAGTVLFVTLAVLLFLLPETALVTALVVGSLLYAAHVCWALAAVTPAYGQLDRTAWRAAALPAAVALGAAVLAGAVIVMPLSLVSIGGWVTIVAAVAVLVLLLILIPRSGDEKKTTRT
ncbi:MAG: hypothetical protein Q4G40_06180 [Brachybacterium sp.]|nr:hypothetical protein [Brachybacterium sp.]